MNTPTRQELLKKIAILEHENRQLRQGIMPSSLNEIYFREILYNIPAPIYLKDAQGKYILINKRYEELAQVTQEKIVGKVDFDIFPEPVAALFRSQDEEVINKKSHLEFEETIPLHDGIHTFITLKFPLYDGNGTVAAVGGFCTDITERKEIEKEQHRLFLEIQKSKHAVEHEKIKNKALTQGKLASLGQMATGIAHEINQPLTFINILFQSLLADLAKNSLDPEELKNDCTESLTQVQRIAKLINHLRLFGRESDSDFEDVTLPRIVDNTLILMRQKLKMNNIGFHFEVQGDAPKVKGRAIELEQVLINLLQNSIDALEDRTPKEIRLSIQAEKGQVRIELKDNGVGVSDDIRDRIFDPFFTTKEVGKGTGIGLSIVHGIVKEHQGEIQCLSGQDGTCFVITLPQIAA